MPQGATGVWAYGSHQHGCHKWDHHWQHLPLWEGYRRRRYRQGGGQGEFRLLPATGGQGGINSSHGGGK